MHPTGIAVLYSCSDGFPCICCFPELWKSSIHLSCFAKTNDFVAVIFHRLAQTSQAVSQSCKYLINLLCTVCVWIPHCNRRLKIKLCWTSSSWIKSPDHHCFCSLDWNKYLKILNSLTNSALGAGMNRALTCVTIALACCMRTSLSLGCISHGICLLSLRRAFRESSDHLVHMRIPPTGPRKRRCLLLLGIPWSPSVDVFPLCQVTHGHKRKSDTLQKKTNQTKKKKKGNKTHTHKKGRNSRNSYSGTRNSSYPQSLQFMLSEDLLWLDCTARLSLSGILGGPKDSVFGLGAGTVVLIAPTCGEVWNQKLGKFLHAVFLVIIIEVQQALDLTCWFWWSLFWRVWGKHRLFLSLFFPFSLIFSLSFSSHRSVCRAGTNFPLGATVPNWLWNLLILDGDWHFLMT